MAFFYDYYLLYPGMTWFWYIMSMWQFIIMLPFMVALLNMLRLLGLGYLKV